MKQKQKLARHSCEELAHAARASFSISDVCLYSSCTDDIDYTEQVQLETVTSAVVCTLVMLVSQVRDSASEGAETVERLSVSVEI